MNVVLKGSSSRYFYTHAGVHMGSIISPTPLWKLIQTKRVIPLFFFVLLQ